MFAMLVYLPLFHVLLPGTESQSIYGCEPGWFGKQCQFKCACSVSRTCKDEGDCPANDKCKKGFFGPGCQYVDLVYTTAQGTVDTYLRDGDDSTCSQRTSAISVDVSFTKQLLFSWYRILVNNNSVLLNFTTTLNDVLPCLGERKFVVSDKIVDVTCDVTIRLRRLVIQGEVAPAICSVYVSGGRNVALKQETNQTSDYEDVDIEKSWSANAVDGNIGASYITRQCSRTSLQGDPPMWQLTYKRPHIISNIRVYNEATAAGQRLRGFILQAFDEAGNIVTYFRDVAATVQTMYEITSTSATPVISVKIKISPNSSSNARILTLCEVETYGEVVCPTDMYGLYCDKTCNCNTSDVCNAVTGVCAPGCQQDYYGYTCSSQCIGNCNHGICGWRSGNCLQCSPGYSGVKCDRACRPGTYGLNCQMNCSTHCIKKLCNSTNGFCSCEFGYAGQRCTECAAGLYGANCALRCSEFCKGGLCDYRNGDCFSCVEERDGYKCTDCARTLYGPKCTAKCSQLCVNQTCQVTGKCFACYPGYHGDTCQSELQPSLLLLIPVVIFLILTIYFCARSRDGENDDEGSLNTGGDSSPSV